MINIIGGTYREIDYDEISVELFGSGFRAAKFLLENKCDVHFHTLANEETLTFLKENQKVYSSLKCNIIPYSEIITFKYSFPLDNPSIFPNILNIAKVKSLSVSSKNIIAFGMLEAEYSIHGEKVVYDPQTSFNPTKFSDIGYAKDLVYIVNKNEANSIAESDNINIIKDYFFLKEKAIAFIIKDGPFGATLYTKDKEIKISSYVTDNVFKIGSGDIFTASFGYYWMDKKLSIEESAQLASKSTAIFCDIKAYIDVTKFPDFKFKEFHVQSMSNKQIYLASPFFAISELILVDKVRNAFLSFGVKLFSPFHDVGIGNTESIAKKDLDGINNSDIIFCLFDNYDSGTLIESGYSLATGKKIIGYHRTCKDEKLLMLKGSNIQYYNHLTTAIYQTIWNL